MHALAETAISLESIAYLLALAAVLFLQQRAATKAKEAIEKSAKEAIEKAAAEAAEKLKAELAAIAETQAKEAAKTAVDLKAIKATTEDTASTVIAVHKFSNGAMGAALNATALSARLLANNTIGKPENPLHVKTAEEAEFAASEHRRKEQDAARVVAQRSEAIAVANAAAAAPDVAAAADHVADAAVDAATAVRGKTP